MTTVPLGLADLPAHLDRYPDETVESHLERLAAVNHLTHPQLLHALDPIAVNVPSSSRPAPQPGRPPTGWTPGRGTQLCPACLKDTGTWRDSWRYPMITVCLTHTSWLHTTCPTCRLRFRSHPHHRLRSVNAPAGTCGNPRGHRGRPCPQELADLSSDPVPPEILASQSRIHAAIAGEEMNPLGDSSPGGDYLAEIKALTVLLLHLAVQPGGDQLAAWADAARRDATRSVGQRRARWGLAPPADSRLRGHALTAADQILAAGSLEDAADRLQPWTELTPHVPDGQLGWLVDHTHMTPTLTRLVLAATAARRRVSTLLDQPPGCRIPTAAIPQALPDHAYAPASAHLDVTDELCRGYASLCLVRRHSSSCTWTDAGAVLDIPPDTATTIARTGASRLTCSPNAWIVALDEIPAHLDPDVNYRLREEIVRHLATQTRWYIRWARVHHPGSPAASRPYAITWLWTTWAAGLLATSPAWPQPPSRAIRAYYRRYTARLSLPAREALLRLVTTNGGTPPMSNRAAYTTREPGAAATQIWALWDAGHLVSLHTTEQGARDAREAHLWRLGPWNTETQELCEQATEILPMPLEDP